MAASEESTVPSSPAEKLGLAPQSDHDLHHAPSDPDRSLETALSEELLQLLLKEAENGEAGGQWRDSVDGNGESDQTDVPIGTEVAVPLEEENGETGGEWSDGAGKHGKSDEIGSEDGRGSERGGGESVGDDDDRVCEWRERGKEERERGLGSGMNLYPLRPEAEDCAYYMKTGSCKFGSCCKFNHPVRRKSHEKVKDKDDLMEKPGQTECKYYSRTGGCRFGKACRYSHPRAKVSTTPLIELNFLGLPIRPGEKECPYYMRTGSCKYASNCRYNHPDPTAVGGGNIVAGGGNIVAGYGNSRPASLQSPSQPVPAAPWSPTGTLKEPAPFMPPVYPPMQGVSSQNTEWNAYRVPVYPPERRVLPPPAFMVKSPTAESNIYSSDKKQMTIDEFPERPGQPDCSFYLKTGDCKFRSNCKYHHPRNRIPSLSSPVPLSDKGLPLRPGQNICSYYSRYGICKFGPACRYDHPVNWTPSNVSAPYSGFTGPDSARMVGSNNGSDIIIQQSM